jgi:HPt (histidine-containing phosphotransfer) domain-containing protein
MSTNDELRARFTREAKDRMKKILEAAGDVATDFGAEAVVNGSVEVMRSQAHMLKGAAGMLDFPDVKDAAASLEDAAAQAIQSGGELAGDALGVALENLGSAIELLGP